MNIMRICAAALTPFLALSFLTGCTASSEPLAEWNKHIEAELVEFAVTEKPCTFNAKSLELLVTLTNKTELNIIDVEATASIQDAKGSEITELNLVGDGSFGPSEQLNVGSWGELCYDLDHSSQRAKGLLELENLEAETAVVIKVNKISFENGEVLEF